MFGSFYSDCIKKMTLLSLIMLDLLVFQLVPDSDDKRAGFFSHLKYEKQRQIRTIFSIFFFMDDEKNHKAIFLYAMK